MLISCNKNTLFSKTRTQLLFTCFRSESGLERAKRAESDRKRRRKNSFKPGFSIEGGTRRLIAAYFGIFSRLLYVLLAFLFLVCAHVFYFSSVVCFEFFLKYLVQNNPIKTTKLAGASVLNNRHVFNDINIRVCDIHLSPALHCIHNFTAECM